MVDLELLSPSKNDAKNSAHRKTAMRSKRSFVERSIQTALRPMSDIEPALEKSHKQTSIKWRIRHVWPNHVLSVPLLRMTPWIVKRFARACWLSVSVPTFLATVTKILVERSATVAVAIASFLLTNLLVAVLAISTLALLFRGILLWDATLEPGLATN